MTAYALSPDFGLIATESDRRFRRLLAALALPALVAGLVIPFIQISGLLKGGGMITPTRYAKLIEQATPAEEPKPLEQTSKVQPTPQITQEQRVERARKRAQKAIASLQDSLSELRDADLPSVAAPLSGEVISSPSGSAPSFASTATATSGGIGETGVVRRESSTGLGERTTTTVKSPLGSGSEQALAGHGGKNLMKGRTLEEIQLVFDRNKGSFYTLYNRALRERPDMQGKVVVRMTIAPSGAVTRCTLVSSDLNHPELERKLVARVLLLQFPAKDVGDITIDFPFTLFPAT